MGLMTSGIGAADGAVGAAWMVRLGADYSRIDLLLGCHDGHKRARTYEEKMKPVTATQGKRFSSL